MTDPRNGWHLREVWFEDSEPTMHREPSKPEPVAWRIFDGGGGYDYRDYEMNENYASEWAQRNPNHKGWVEPLYTAPPQRGWQGLTDEEIRAEWLKVIDPKGGDEIKALARAIEAKLKEKNGF